MVKQILITALKLLFYRILLVFAGLLVLGGLLSGGLVWVFSAVLLLINLPILYCTAENVARTDLKPYTDTSPAPWKGLAIGLTYTILVFLMIFVLHFLPFGGWDFAFQAMYSPYKAFIGLGSSGFQVSYILIVLCDIATATLGYFAGRKEMYLFSQLRLRMLYDKKNRPK